MVIPFFDEGAFESVLIITPLLVEWFPCRKWTTLPPHLRMPVLVLQKPSTHENEVAGYSAVTPKSAIGRKVVLTLVLISCRDSSVKDW